MDYTSDEQDIVEGEVISPAVDFKVEEQDTSDRDVEEGIAKLRKLSIKQLKPIARIMRKGKSQDEKDAYIIIKQIIAEKKKGASLVDEKGTKYFVAAS